MTTNTTNLQTAVEPKSILVLLSLIFLFAAFAMAIIAATFSFPFVAALAVIDGLASVTFAVLSLRERG